MSIEDKNKKMKKLIPSTLLKSYFEHQSCNFTAFSRARSRFSY